jgi:hypothetical protein
VLGPSGKAQYVCYPWLACEIPRLKGSLLRDGDRLLVAPNGTDCRSAPSKGVLQVPSRESRAANAPIKEQWARHRRYPYGDVTYQNFPQGGVSSPAVDDGRRYSWGTMLLRVPPGVYTLCWCDSSASAGNCSETGPFTLGAGTLRVGTYKELLYLTRTSDPGLRQLDDWYSYVLAFPLPAIFCMAVCAGWKRLSAREEAEGPDVVLQKRWTRWWKSRAKNDATSLQSMYEEYDRYRVAQQP